MQRTWGTSRVREVQLMLALEESTSRPPTLLTKLLYILGLSGLTMAWELTGLEYTGINKQTMTDEEDMRKWGSLTGALYKHGWEQVKQYWQGGKRPDSNKHLAEGIRLLIAAGITCADQLRHPSTGGWWIETEIPVASWNAVIAALEGSFPAIKRHSVLKQMKAAAASAEQAGDEAHNEQRPPLSPSPTSKSKNTRKRRGLPPSTLPRHKQTKLSFPSLPGTVHSNIPVKEDTTWLPTTQPAAQHTDAVQCRLFTGAREQDSIVTSHGIVRIGRGRARGEQATVSEQGGLIKTKHAKVDWQGEAAKLQQWLAREKTTWEELYPKVQREAEQANQNEARGFRMVAWPILQQMQTQTLCNVMVGRQCWKWIHSPLIGAPTATAAPLTRRTHL
jgi:hypothetical protein